MLFSRIILHVRHNQGTYLSILIRNGSWKELSRELTHSHHAHLSCSIEEKNIKDEDGNSFVFRRPFQFCCLPNKYFAITDKVLDCLYIIDQSEHILARIKLPGHIRALSCDQDNRIYMTCYETNSICILDTNGTCLSTISLKCILNKPRTISVRSEEAILVTNKYEVVLLSLK